MNRAMISVCAALLFVSGCNTGDEPEVSQAANDGKLDVAVPRTSKVQSPVRIDYRVIGTPIVGQAVTVELQLQSTLGAQPYKLSYRVNDPTAMQMPESQSATVSVSPSADDESSSQRVTVIPLREGRLYLNVAAVIETESGSMQTVTAIPIQVGPAAPRQFLDNGTITSDEEGNLIRSMPAKED